MEYSQKLILKYFIGPVGEFQNNFLEFNFTFYTFGPLRKLAWHRAVTDSAKILSI